MNTTLKRFRRYGELGLAPDIVTRLAYAEGGLVTPLLIAFYEGRWYDGH